MRKYIATALCAAAACSPAFADSVLLSEDFNGDYSANFPTVLELDKHAPVPNINSVFMNGEGVSMPWWHVKDSSASNDRFLASHSVYSPAAQSNDWVVSRPIDIPTSGYTLEFDAQSVAFRMDEDHWLSTLHVFISRYNIDEEYQPEAEEAELIIEEVPWGNDYEAAEGDFTHYSINLDKFAGKRVWIAFANLNYDKDILVIDNVKVSRPDSANLTAFVDEMVVGGEHTFTLSVETSASLKNWNLLFTDDNGTKIAEYSGEEFAENSKENFNVNWNVPADKVSNWIATLTADGILPIVQKGEITALTYKPFHRVLVEEATGIWCSNCPLGMYNMEEMDKHELTKDFVIPVSVHIAGGADYLVNTNYQAMLNLQAAPSYRVDRELVARYFSLTYDTQFDPTRPLSMGNLVLNRHNELTTLEIDMEAKVNDVNNPTQILCTTTINPALSMDGSNLRIGFIMKENNVWSDNSYWMAQENGTSGNDIEGNLGGWTLMPHKVYDIKYHDVARGIINYNGLDNSVPKKLQAGKKETFSYTVPIPDTYKTIQYQGIDMLANPAVDINNVVMVAFVVDLNTMRVLNSVQVPMSDTALEKDMSWLTSGVETLPGNDLDFTGPEVYYDLQGRQVTNPSKGLYIRVRGSKAEKIML